MNARTLKLYDGDTFEHDGRTFRVRFEHDSDHEAPWDDGDGRGIVSEWTTRDKCPGERVLHQDGRSKRYFDFAGAVAKAREEGWNTAPYGKGTKGERAARAAEAEFEFLRLWCADQWEYVGVTVEQLGRDGAVIREDSLWGVETYKDYHQEVARELAGDLIATEKHERKLKAKETREARYWAARGMETRP